MKNTLHHFGMQYNWMQTETLHISRDAENAKIIPWTTLQNSLELGLQAHECYTYTAAWRAC